MAARETREGERTSSSMSPVADKEDLNDGLYGLTELSRYVAYHHWKQPDISRTARWLSRALNPVHHERGRPDYSFHDLISLFVVRELVAAGVRLPAIRAAESHLRQRLELARPFASVKLKTDGVNVLYRAAPEVRFQLTAADLHGQEVLAPTIQTALQDVYYERSVAVRWRPDPHVELDPRVQFGEPCVLGTRIPTGQIAALVAEGGDFATIARLYDIPIEAAEHAVRFERELASKT
jgi:uncharacterized protein (DUF433 family)